jgi:coenzyme F420-dependent glucose-6-phosphate dehydrogenase
MRILRDYRGSKKPNEMPDLCECACIIRALLGGETVSHSGRVTARLYSLPKKLPLLLGAAVTEATAELVGCWADGLLTVNAKPRQVRKVVDAFYQGGGQGKPLLMLIGLNWARSEQQAVEGSFSSGNTTCSAVR